MIGFHLMSDFPWMIGAIVTPLLTACAMLGLRRWSASIGLLCSLAIAAIIACLGYQVVRLGPQHMDVGGWSVPLGIRLHADGLGVCLLGITALVGSFVSLYAAAYFRTPDAAAAPPPSARYFWPLWMFLWAALNALFLSADIFNVYVGLEMLGLSSVALVALSNTPPAISAAMRYLLVSLLGSLSYLMGVAFLYGAMGTLDTGSLAAALAPAPFSYAALSLMSAGLLMKTALFPLHSWLPPAHANASAPVSALLSALVVKASFYVLYRLWFDVFGNIITTGAGYIPGVLGGAAILWGSIQALSAQRLKQLIAYSTVAQVGYLFLVFPLGMATAAPTFWTARSAAFYFVIAHACAKAAVFLTAGNVLRAFGHDRIEELRGSVQQLPISMLAFGIAGVSLIGLPPSGGFIAKWLYLNAALEGHHWGYVGVISAGGLLATAYIFRFFSRAFSYVPETGAFTRVPRSMEWSAFALAMCAMALGLVGAQVMDLLPADSPISRSVWAGGQP